MDAFELGRLQFRANQVAMLLGVTVEAFVASEDANNYLRGRLEAQVFLRQELMRNAEAGCRASIKEMLSLAANSEPEIEED